MSADSPLQTVESYFAAVLNADARSLESIFADDAVVAFGPATLVGSTAIAEFYRQVFAKDTPQPQLRRPFLQDGNRVAVEIDVHYEGTNTHAADFFTVTAGRISHLRVYPG